MPSDTRVLASILMEQTVLVAETQCSAVAPPVAQMSLSSLAPQPPPKSTPPSPPVLSPHPSLPQNSRIAGGEIVAAHAALLSSPSSSPAQTSARAFARVLFDYEADNAEELTLKVGQFIEVTRDAIHLCNLSCAPTNFSRRLRRKPKVVGGVAKSMEKRCAPVHAFVLFSRLF